MFLTKGREKFFLRLDCILDERLDWKLARKEFNNKHWRQKMLCEDFEESQLTDFITFKTAPESYHYAYIWADRVIKHYLALLWTIKQLFSRNDKTAIAVLVLTVGSCCYFYCRIFFERRNCQRFCDFRLNTDSFNCWACCWRFGESAVSAKLGRFVLQAKCCSNIELKLGIFLLQTH